MKQRFNALDLRVALFELRKSFSGCRVTNIYDVDHKTYLIKLAKPDSKAVILIESGIRIHSTEFEVPKNLIPSGFSMKLRKHLRSRRLEKVNQVGADRIVDLQFGSNEAAYHLIIELYDRGNILLTDYEYTIISVLRPRTDENSDVKFTVREKYPLHLARQDEHITLEKLNEIFAQAKPNDDVKRLLTTHLTFGASLIEHSMSSAQLTDKCILGKTFDINKDLTRLYDSLVEGEKIMNLISNESCAGYIIQKATKAPKLENGSVGEEDILIYDEFQPYLWKRYETASYIRFDTFDRAVDEFFSKLETQKLEMKESQQNREAVKKLENVKKDHQKRLEDLKKSQTEDELKAKLIEYNLELVDHAIYLVNSAIANQLSWNEINEIIEEAKEDNHVVARSIKQLKLDINHIVLNLKNPYDYYDDDDEQDNDDIDEENKEYSVEIDLSLTAFKNSRKYYEMKKSLFVKEQKTIQASDKALKSAEKHTLDILKQANKIKTITKARKPFWFEKFYWFISSENYLVIGGRDQQQNEIVVKKYLKSGDIYVHADLNGASSVVIKNPSGKEVPPKTLNEAGCMAVCYSVAWEAKVLANAWWVYHNQVSKQAPTGEYIGTGSFMIRGKKNYLISSALVFGFGLMYKLDDASIERHKNDRRIKTAEEDHLADEKYSNVEFEEAAIVEEEDEVNEQAEDLKAQTDKNENEDNLEEVQPVEEKETEEKNLQQNENEEKEESSSDEKVDKEEGDEDDEEETAFPDTQFELKSVAKLEDKTSHLELEEKTEDTQSNKNISKKQINKQEDQQQVKKPNQNGQFKRGQKSKLNKMKTKYKDQDDEDREIFMKYLAPAGDSSKNKNNKKATQIQQQPKKQQQQQQKKTPKPLIVNKQPNEHSDDLTQPQLNLNEIDTQVDQDEETTEQNIEDELAIINSLTGMPLDEDEILFCIPVCAPYNCIQNYKHKVKLNPGTTKRGQAVKTAIEIFLRDKQTTLREKDLIKSNLLKDQDNSRNLPGKVKVSAPNLIRLKKK